MNLLLDTHVFLWWDRRDPGLNTDARAAIEDPRNDVFVSAASVWEIAIKRSLGKLTMPADFAEAVAASGLHDLPITRAHGLAVDHAALPHRDPFDAMLVGQARSERLTFLTADGAILTAWDEAVDARR